MPHKDKYHKDQWRAKVMREGHMKTKFFPTKTAALEWEAEQRKVPLEEFLRGTPTAYSLAEWAEKYLDQTKHEFTFGVYEEKKRAFRKFFEVFDPSSDPTELHRGEILIHFSKQARDRTGNAANRDRKNLVAAWNWAVKYLRGWPERNPFKVDKQKAQQHPRYVPPEEDFWKVYDYATGQDKVMLLTYLHTAARKSEIFQLLWEDVDFEGKRIRLWTNKRKGGREFDWIPLTNELQEALEEWKKVTTFPNEKHVFLCDFDEPFCSDYYGKPYLVRKDWMKRTCERAGVKHFGIHAIRHLTASILDDKGYPLTVIQALLRHQNANTTSKYLHKLRGLKTALDDAFQRRKPKGDPPKQSVAEEKLEKEGHPQESERPSGRPILRIVR